MVALAVSILLSWAPVFGQVQDESPAAAEADEVIPPPASDDETAPQTEAAPSAANTETFELIEEKTSEQRSLAAGMNSAWRSVLSEQPDYPSLKGVRELLKPPEEPTLGEQLGAQLLVVAAEALDQAR